MSRVRGTSARYAPYVPRVLQTWDDAAPGSGWREVDGSLVFVDISGFTALSERLARRGRRGAEELTDTISECFGSLLGVAYGGGGSLLKFGGDALLLLFDGPDHAHRAVEGALRMRSRMVETGRVTTSVGNVRLRMSVGAHSGPIHLFRVGSLHHELIVAGPGVSATVSMESTAQAGQIVVSPQLAAAIDPAFVGEPAGAGFLVRNRRLAPQPDVHPALDATRDLTLEVPVALRHHLARDVEPEHRQATIAFVHFDGIDVIIEREGSAVAAAALEELTSDVQEVAADEGITFLASDADHDGGKLILVAGAPRALGDDEGRALRALRRIADVDRRLSTRFGVNRGHVFVGGVGPAYRRTFTVMGDTVNLAARLMAHAAPTQIVATESVLAASSTPFDAVPLPPFTVKGKSEPVEAHLVQRRLEARQAMAADVTLPFVGRAQQLDELGATLARVHDARGAVVELVGEAGIGKSRLLREALDRDQRCRAVVAVCEPSEAATPYFGVRHLLRGAIDVRPQPGDGADELRHVVRTSAPELEPWLPLLAAVIGVDTDQTAETRDLEPQARRDHTRRVVIALLEAVVHTATAFVVEDAQWIDDASADVLQGIAHAALRRPWLVCVIRRPEQGAFTPDDALSPLQVDLGPLDEAESRALVASASTEVLLRPDQRDAIVRHAGGNPLFLTGLLTTGPTGSDALPESLEALVATQIDRLDPEDSTLLRFAAVLGPVFEIRQLSELVRDQARVTPAAVLRRLATFLEPAGAGWARFRNQCYRQVAYETLSFGRRRQLHERAARAIESSAKDPVAEQAEVLSFHYLHAQDHPRCWTYAVAAARQAAAAYANVEAVALYERAIAAARLAGSDDREVAEVWEALGDLALVVGIPERAKHAFGRARRLASADDIAAARLCKKESFAAMYQGQHTNVMRWVNRGLRKLEGDTSAEALTVRAELHVQCSEHRMRMGHYRAAIAEADLAIADATLAGDRPTLARAYTVRDLAALNLGMLDEVTHLADALAIWEELGMVRDQAAVLTVMGVTAYFASRWDEAVDRYARGAEAYLRAGDAVEAAYGQCNIAEILVDQGRGDEAEVTVREVLDLWRSVHHPGPMALALVLLGRCAMQRGELDAAVQLLEQAREHAGSPDESLAIAADAFLAECCIRTGEPADALERADSLLRRTATTGDTTYTAQLRRVRGQALAALDRRSEAVLELEWSLDAARARESLYEEALTLDLLGALVRVDDVGRAVEANERASRIFDDLGVAESLRAGGVVQRTVSRPG